jgi:hypothetical protein
MKAPGSAVASPSGLYTFEDESGRSRKLPSRRKPDDAATELLVLKARLRISAELSEECEKMLLKYCTEVVLNILWYERARKREQRTNRRFTLLMIVLMVVALLLLGASAVPELLKPGAVVGAGLPLALLAGAVMTVLQVLASLADGKTRLSIFWKAGADLKEALYTFEEKWNNGSAFAKDTGILTPEFVKAVNDELRAARAVTRAERLEYFSTLRSPTDVLAVAVASADALRARRAEGATTIATREQKVGDARRTVVDARAAVLASEYRLARLTVDAEKVAEESVLLKAQAELVRAESVAKEVVGG